MTCKVCGTRRGVRLDVRLGMPVCGFCREDLAVRKRAPRYKVSFRKFRDLVGNIPRRVAWRIYEAYRSSDFSNPNLFLAEAGV